MAACFLQNIAEVFPFLQNNEIGPYEVKVYANALPTTRITTSGISINLPGVVELLSKPVGRTPKTLLNLQFTLRATAMASISSNVLKGYVSSTNLNVTGVTPPLPNVDKSLINTSIMSFVNLILPFMNEKLDQGMPLPTVQGVGFIQGSLVLNSRYLSASANVRYLPWVPRFENFKLSTIVMNLELQLIFGSLIIDSCIPYLYNPLAVYSTMWCISLSDVRAWRLKKMSKILLQFDFWTLAFDIRCHWLSSSNPSKSVERASRESHRDWHIIISLETLLQLRPSNQLIIHIQKQKKLLML